MHEVTAKINQKQRKKSKEKAKKLLMSMNNYFTYTEHCFSGDFREGSASALLYADS